MMEKEKMEKLIALLTKIREQSYNAAEVYSRDERTRCNVERHQAVAWTYSRVISLLTDDEYFDKLCEELNI